jgi:hypothetical protein
VQTTLLEITGTLGKPFHTVVSWAFNAQRPRRVQESRGNKQESGNDASSRSNCQLRHKAGAILSTAVELRTQISGLATDRSVVLTNRCHSIISVASVVDSKPVLGCRIVLIMISWWRLNGAFHSTLSGSSYLIRQNFTQRLLPSHVSLPKIIRSSHVHHYIFPHIRLASVAFRDQISRRAFIRRSLSHSSGCFQI